jgi:hypothetical protein
MQSTLLGLLSACNFELSVLQCANRVVGADSAGEQAWVGLRAFICEVLEGVSVLSLCVWIFLLGLGCALYTAWIGITCLYRPLKQVNSNALVCAGILRLGYLQCMRPQGALPPLDPGNHLASSSTGGQVGMRHDSMVVTHLPRSINFAAGSDS